jgi:hypothetical protein
MYLTFIDKIYAQFKAKLSNKQQLPIKFKCYICKLDLLNNCKKDLNIYCYFFA